MTHRKSKPVKEQATDAIRRRHAKIIQHVEGRRDELAEQARRKMAELEPIREVMAQLKTHRERAGLSLTDLAKRTGIDKSNLSKLENARYPNATVDTLTRIATALGVRLRWVVEAA
ncbi:MAG: helix-turn-helix domain-containing protein [Planctomycetes bacterium]|nr:helix-turn-helix domain-containing protein [Planctomycetota bacterium]